MLLDLCPVSPSKAKRVFHLSMKLELHRVYEAEPGQGTKLRVLVALSRVNRVHLDLPLAVHGKALTEL